MYCPKCGKEANDGDKFCIACGQPISQNDIPESNSEENPGTYALKMTPPATKTNQESNKSDSKKGRSNGRPNIATKLFGGVLADIRQSHVYKFLRYQHDAKHTGILIYTAVLLLPNLLLVYGSPLMVFLPVIITFWICNLVLNRTGQKYLGKILGAREIERVEYVDLYKRPAEEIINKARAEGMTLPETINIYVYDSENPQVYAIGMNTIILSSGAAGLPEDVFEAMMRTELYRIEHMCPDYLLYVLGSNIIGLCLVLLILGVTRFSMSFGSRRKSFWTGMSDSEGAAIGFYLTIALAAMWVGICFILIKKPVREDILNADRYVASCGLGEAQCRHLDYCRLMGKNSAHYQLLTIGYPSPDDRIAALQEAGVGYYR